MPQVLFVCSGNTCRSPAAAALLRKKLEESGYVGWQVASAGITAEEGRRAASHSVPILAERGIDLTKHRSRAFNLEQVAASTLILCMEQAHVNWLKRHFSQQFDQVYLLGAMSNRQHDVPDPYGGDPAAYRKMVNQLLFLIEAGLPRIIALAKEE